MLEPLRGCEQEYRISVSHENRKGIIYLTACSILLCSGIVAGAYAVSNKSSGDREILGVFFGVFGVAMAFQCSFFGFNRCFPKRAIKVLQRDELCHQIRLIEDLEEFRRFDIAQLKEAGVISKKHARHLTHLLWIVSEADRQIAELDLCYEREERLQVKENKKEEFRQLLVEVKCGLPPPLFSYA